MASKPSLRVTLVADSIRNVSANLFNLPISFISSLLIARILGPELTGITAAAITLVLTYTVNSHMGTLNALGQRYPYLIGQGSEEARAEAKRMLGVVLGFVGVAALGSATVVLGLAAWQYYKGSSLFALGLCFGAAVATLQLFKTYYLFVVRSTNQFAFWSRYTLMFAWVPLAWLIGARWGGVVGQWVALGATELLMSVSLYRSIGRNITWEFDLKASWRYIKLGLPIYIMGTLFGFFTTIDRLTAATFLGTTALGLYGVASMGGTILGIVPGMISQIMWPRMAEKLGATGDQWREMLPYIEKPTFLMAFLLPPVTGAVVLAISPVTELLLPRYVPGVAAAQVSVLSVYFLGLMGMCQVFLGTSLRLLPYGLIAILGIAIHVVGSYLAVHFGFGLEGIAWTKTLSHGVVAVLFLAYVGKLFGYTWKGLIYRIIIMLAPMATVYILTFWLIPWLVPSNGTTVTGMLIQLGYRIAILILLTCPLVWFGLHSSGVTGDVLAIFRRIFHLETGVRWQRK